MAKPYFSYHFSCFPKSNSLKIWQSYISFIIFLALQIRRIKRRQYNIPPITCLIYKIKRMEKMKNRIFYCCSLQIIFIETSETLFLPYHHS